jgi:hypothetical protein
MNSNSPPRNNTNSLVNSNTSYMQSNFNMNSGSSSAASRQFSSSTGYDCKLNERSNPKYKLFLLIFVIIK